MIQMSEPISTPIPITEAERIKQLDDKLQKIRMDKLLIVEEVADQIRHDDEEMAKLMKELDKLQETITACDLKEVFRYKELGVVIKSKVALLNSRRQRYNELRLLIKNLGKEEERVMFLKMKANMGTTG